METQTIPGTRRRYANPLLAYTKLLSEKSCVPIGPAQTAQEGKPMELRTPKYLIVRTRGPEAAYWARFKHPVLNREVKMATGIFIADLRRGESFSGNLAKFIGDEFWWDTAREREAQTLDPIAAQVFYAPMRGYESTPDAPSTEFQEALKQARGERDAAIEQVASLQLELQEAKREIARLTSQLGLSVVDRDWTSALTEYLAWGNAGGGRLGKPWSVVHARQQDTRLIWWGNKLQRPALTAISLSAVEQSIAKFVGAAKTKSDYVMTLRGFLSWARRHGYLSVDPLTNLAKLGKESETDWRSLSFEEVRRLLVHCASERRLFYELAVSTGMRVGEILALTWLQIDFENHCIRAKASDTKSKKKVMQPLPLTLLEKLKPLMGLPSAPILTLPPNYHRGWRSDIGAANVPYETPAGLAVVHSLRKSYTTLLQELAGASLSEAQKLARHSTPALTSNVYTKSSQSKLLSLVDCLGERLLA